MDENTEQVEKTVTRASEDELSDEELSEVAGGTGSLSFEKVVVTYTPQKADGS